MQKNLSAITITSSRGIASGLILIVFGPYEQNAL